MSPIWMLAMELPEWARRLLGVKNARWDPDSDLSISWAHDLPPTWVIFLVVIPIIFGIFFAVYRGERKDAGFAPKLLLALVRAVLVLMIFFMLFGPALTVDKRRDRKAFILILVDESYSMSKKDAPLQLDDQLRIARATGLGDGATLSDAQVAQIKDLTRLQIVQAALKNPSVNFLKELEKKTNVAIFSFWSPRVTPRSDTEVQTLLPEKTNGETAIGEAMRQAFADRKGQTVLWVVLFTDGRSNSGRDPADVAAEWAKRYISVFTVSPGVPRREVNLELQDLQAVEALIAGEIMDVRFRIKSFGFQDDHSANVQCFVCPLPVGEEIPQTADAIERRLEGLRVEREKTVTLRGGEQEDSFAISPKTPGNYALIVKAQRKEGENTYEDNYLVQGLKVVDEKIRVLYVDHWPRWEYRFLKNALIRDEKIKAHILLTSADQSFAQDCSKGLDPLKEFPSTLKELLEYDVLILGDVPLDHIGGEESAKNIELFCSEHGGGVVFVAGTEFNPGHFRGTTLDKVLPVVPEEAGVPTAVSSWERELPYKLTVDGKKDNITAMEKDSDRNQKVWEAGDDELPGLPRLRYYVRVKRVKANARTLVNIIDPTQEQPVPLFVTGPCGQGRVFFSATDETYRWRWLRGDNPYFYPFWQRAMYWARMGKLLGAQRYRVTVERLYKLGDPVKISVNAYDMDFKPLTQDKLDVFIEPPPPGDRITVELKLDVSNPGRFGHYTGTYTPKDVGEYRIRAGDPDDPNKDYKRFTVYVPNREEDKPIIDSAALQAVAAASYHADTEKPPASGVKGYYQIDELGALAAAIRKHDLQLRDTTLDDLWDAPIVYILFALLITTEWIVRKIFRML